MSAHTPGPWAAEEEERVERTGALIGVYVAKVDPSTPNGLNGRICQAYGNCLVTTADELRANARLIAAAPELLDRLRETTNALHAACLVITDAVARTIALDMVKDARATIAKVQS